MRAFGRLIPGRNKTRPFSPDSESEEDKELRKQKTEEDQQRKKLEVLEQVLPWNLEQKFSLYLNPIKVPLVLFVTVLGCYVEHQLAKTQLKAWKAPFSRTGPTCWVHELEEDLINRDIRSISNFLNATFFPFTSRINKELLRHKDCKQNAMGQTECNFFRTPEFLDFPVDYCGVTETCGIEGTLVEEKRGYYGLAWRVPFIPFSLVWAIYKLVFLPFYPVDRMVNFLEGYPQPMSEPIFKLLTEPFSQHCAIFMNMCAKVGKVIRYSLLPNSIMLPLFSMSKRRNCPKYIFYDMDTMFASLIYAYVLFDLLLVFASYIIGKFLVGECINTCKYRMYKAYWFCSLWTSIGLFFMDLVFVFDIRFWQGLFVWLDLTFVFDPNLTFAIDMCKKLLGFNMMLDYVQLVILILGIFLPRLPCLKETTDSYELLPTASKQLNP